MAVYIKTKAEIDADSLKRRGKHFFIVKSTSFTKIIYDGKVLQYSDRNFGGVKGAHLSRMVRSDVDRLIPLDQVPKDEAIKMIHPPTVYANPAMIDHYLNDYIYHIDIKNCYWNFALKTGVISKRTYVSGLKKREWKIGRNVSIGSLDKHERIEEWRGKELVDVERIHTPANYKYARLKIINEVNKLALEAIHDVLKDGFVMFLTDCFCVRSTHIKKLTSFLESRGYEHTSAGIVIKKHDAERMKITWDKIEVAQKKESGQQFLVPDRNKFIHYIEEGIINL